jgi:hypothetical protein
VRSYLSESLDGFGASPGDAALEQLAEERPYCVERRRMTAAGKSRKGPLLLVR